LNISTSGKNPKAIVMNVRERTRGWLNAVNLHWTGVALLALVNVYLLVQMGLAWRAASSGSAEAIAQQRVELKGAEIAAKPLEGLDVKLAAAGGKADSFYRERLPISYSEIASELGVLKNKDHVRLSRINYSQPTLKAGATSGSGAVTVPESISAPGPNHLTEVLMDANLTGDYRGLVQFINGLERDRIFFLVNGITLTGQQTGQVSLRIRLTTYLRGVVSADELEKVNAASGSMSSDLDQTIEKQQRKAQPATVPVKAGGAR
jgi:type IV pilus assembly protein PilO